MKVVVTGGAGFIGSNLCGMLHEMSDITDVIAYDNLETGLESNIDSAKVRLMRADILDDEGLLKAFQGASCVVHLAALPSVPRSIVDPYRTHTVNATGTLKVLVAARKADVPHVIVASSSSVYGANIALPKRETMQLLPMSPYAVSKLATEQYALAWAHSYGMGTLAFRFFNVFGPRQLSNSPYAAVIPKFIEAGMKGEPVVVNGDGLQTRDFTFVGTVCEVLRSAIVRRMSHSSAVNLAFGTETSLMDLIAEIEVVLGKRINRVHAEPRVGDVRHSSADSSVLRGLFPDIKPVSLQGGLSETIRWMRGSY